MHDGGGRYERSGFRILGAALRALGALIAAVAPGADASAGPLHALRRAAGAGDQTCVRDTAADIRFVALGYQAVLGRAGSFADVASLAAHLQYPTSFSYVQIAEALTHSSEARGGVVATMYATLLHRTPSGADLNGWVPWLATRTPVDMAMAIAESAEYWNQSGGTNAGWVDRIYADLLGRAPDDGGRAWWIARLDAGVARSSAARDLYRSSERSRIVTSALYPRVFGRPVDPAGLAHWSDQMGAHDETWVLTQLVASGEFWQRAQLLYGGAATPQPPPCPKPPQLWPPSPRLVYGLGAYPSSTPRLIALTFDDGPNPTWTPKVLDVLAAKGVKATFFVVGTWAQRYPALIRRELAEGHHVANHTWDHESLTSLNSASQADVIRRTTVTLNGIAGRNVVHCVRPPYGNRNAGTDSVAFGQGLSVIIWTRDSGDWRRPGVPQILRGALDTTYDAGRGIVVMHDGGGDRSQTVAALGTYIDTLRSQGYRFVTVC